jgi:phosphate transport system ATP-binding protein
MDETRDSQAVEEEMSSTMIDKRNATQQGAGKQSQSNVPPTPSDGGLEARSVHAWFGNHHALADVSLTFPARTVTGLIGPSGCGKSTFIRLLNRMHEHIPKAAMAGQVLLDGKDIYSSQSWDGVSKTQPIPVNDYSRECIGRYQACALKARES